MNLLSRLLFGVFVPLGACVSAAVPRSAIVQDANDLELVIASGRPVKVWATAGALPSRCVFWSRIPGFSWTNRITLASGFGPAGMSGFAYDRELFYALKPDIIHIDPVQLSLRKGWGRDAVAEIARRVAPFSGNRFSRDFRAPRGVEGYVFRTIPERAREVAALYDASERMERILGLVAAAECAVTSRLAAAQAPAPRVALLYANPGARFTPFRLNAGNGQAQYRLLGVRDAYAGFDFRDYGDGGPNAAIDLETLLAVNPDVIVMPFAGSAPSDDRAALAFRDLLELGRHPVARRIAAFGRGRVIPGGTPLQGPVVYLFQLEMAAKQIYPQVFGPWRADGAYPPAERLFDRQALADMLQ